MINEKIMWIVVLIVLAILLAVMITLLVRSALNSGLQTEKVEITLDELPESFDGLKIAHLSDLHGCHVDGLLETVQKYSPDLIFCSGDLFDGVQHVQTTIDLLEELKQIAPVYLVSGNHEYYSGNWNERMSQLKEMGLHVLNNEVEYLDRNGQILEISGLRDPDLMYKWSAAKRKEQLHEDMQSLPAKQNCRLMLFHRADLFDELDQAGPDLTFSGHLHGGHWRIFGHGVLAPNDGDRVHLFPKYDGGLFEKDGRKLIVSRGLGDQMAVPRLFNPPELVLVELHSPQE